MITELPQAQLSETEGWKQQHKDIADKYYEIIERNIPPDILIQGVTVDFRLPTEGKLTLRFQRKSGEIEERVLVFAAPSQYSNAFKNRRRTFYTLLKKYAFVLGKGQGGRNLYLIPLANVPVFLEGVKFLNEEFETLGEDINAYLRSETGERDAEFLDKVKEYLKEQGENDTISNLSFKLSLKVTLMPLKIDSDTFMTFASDEINREMSKSLHLLKEEFNQTRENLVHNMIADLTARFATVLSRLAGALERKTTVKYNTISQIVDDTMILADSLNMSLPTFERLAEATKETAEILSKKNYKRAAILTAASKIARALEIEGEDPNEILKKASYDLNSMSIQAATVIRRM